jgi:hypothetical protein
LCLRANASLSFSLQGSGFVMSGKPYLRVRFNPPKSSSASVGSSGLTTPSVPLDMQTRGSVMASKESKKRGNPEAGEEGGAQKKPKTRGEAIEQQQAFKKRMRVWGVFPHPKNRRRENLEEVQDTYQARGKRSHARDGREHLGLLWRIPSTASVPFPWKRESGRARLLCCPLGTCLSHRSQSQSRARRWRFSPIRNCPLGRVLGME